MTSILYGNHDIGHQERDWLMRGICSIKRWDMGEQTMDPSWKEMMWTQHHSKWHILHVLVTPLPLPLVHKSGGWLRIWRLTSGKD